MALAHTVYKNLSDDMGEISLRNEMILQELPQVHYIASRILDRLPQQVELDDLVSAGVLGLIDAYRCFDPTKNAQFSTFAKFRIKGSILDSLRALDWGSRGIRRKGREISEATAKLESSLGRTPRGEEVAAELGITLAALNEVQKELSGLYIVGQEVASSVEGGATVDLIESAASLWDNPFEVYRKTEEKARLVKAVSELSEREQLILSLYYVEELTMREVAEVVDLAISRVSQIHAATLLKLRTSLEARPNEELAEMSARSIR
jgi:RNA polymerase sigma factor for flagellar operon FliA